MSAPTADLFDDRTIDHLDHLDHAIDPLAAGGLALAALSMCSWAAAIVTHVTHARAANSGLVVLASALAAGVSVCAVMCWCAAAIRAHHRRMAVLVVIALAERRRHPDTGPDTPTDVQANWRSYIAGRLDRPDDLL